MYNKKLSKRNCYYNETDLSNVYLFNASKYTEYKQNGTIVQR